MDQKEIRRIEEIIQRMESKYPKNTLTEKILNEIFQRVTKIDKAVLTGSKDTCTQETEELNKYASFNENFALDVKDNIDEALFEKSLKKFQECLQSKNKDFSSELQNLDMEFYQNNNSLNKCIDDCTVGSKEKTDVTLEDCFYNCFLAFEDKQHNIAQIYNEKIKNFEKKYISDTL